MDVCGDRVLLLSRRACALGLEQRMAVVLEGGDCSVFTFPGGHGDGSAACPMRASESRCVCVCVRVCVCVCVCV